MAITDKEQGVWNLDEVYNKINQGDIWEYNGVGSHSLFTWGNDFQGAGGRNTNGVARSSPTQVGTDATWSSVSSTYAFNYLALKSDGTLWSWGRNTSGTIGKNDRTNRSSPTQIGTGTDWRMIGGMGSEANLATKTDGTLWAWGYNGTGEAGQNTTTSGLSSPTQIPGTTWKKVNRAKSQSTAQGGAVKTDGTLWMWGNNNQGNLAQNNLTQRSSPTQVGTDTTWDDIFSGGYANFGLKTDGTLWSWGKNAYGILGLNSGPNNQRFSSPVQIGTNTNWKFVDTEVYTRGVAVALKTDGTLWSWGYNNSGELGKNNRTAYSSPIQIPGTWAQAAGVNQGVVAIKTDGTLWAWGKNNGMDGQLGKNQNATNWSSPTQIGTNTNWVAEPDSPYHRSITGSEKSVACLRDL